MFAALVTRRSITRSLVDHTPEEWHVTVEFFTDDGESHTVNCERPRPHARLLMWVFDSYCSFYLEMQGYRDQSGRTIPGTQLVFVRGMSEVLAQYASDPLV